jgi:hypothetical protein
MSALRTMSEGVGEGVESWASSSLAAEDLPFPVGDFADFEEGDSSSGQSMSSEVESVVLDWKYSRVAVLRVGFDFGGMMIDITVGDGRSIRRIVEGMIYTGGRKFAAGEQAGWRVTCRNHCDVSWERMCLRIASGSLGDEVFRSDETLREIIAVPSILRHITVLYSSSSTHTENPILHFLFLTVETSLHQQQ